MGEGSSEVCLVGNICQIHLMVEGPLKLGMKLSMRALVSLMEGSWLMSCQSRALRTLERD